MAIFNGENYEKQYVMKPSEKVEKGEVAGRKRLILEHKILDSALAIGDEILGLYIPATSLVVDAKVYVSKSLGTTGIFEAGFKANGIDSELSNAFITAADAGGQPALARAEAANAGMFKRFEKDTQVFIKCTEAMDGSVLDGVIYLEVEYVND